MRIRFNTPAPTEQVTFHRGEERISLVLSLLPLGYRDYLTARYPEERVTHYEEMKPVRADDPEWRGKWAYLLLAKSLEPMELFDAIPPNGGSDRGAWSHYASAVQGEFSDAGFTELQIAHLLERLHALEQSTIQDGGSPEQSAGN